jgi:hypothetical protein
MPLRSRVGKRATIKLTVLVAFICAVAPIVIRCPHRGIGETEEGWSHTILGVVADRYRLSSVHYPNLSSPVVLAPTDQSKREKTLCPTESSHATFAGRISVVNDDRLQRRRASHKANHEILWRVFRAHDPITGLAVLALKYNIHL